MTIKWASRCEFILLVLLTLTFVVQTVRTVKAEELLWTVTENPSAKNDASYGVAVDNAGVYTVGYDSSPGDPGWRIEKRSLTDGTLIWQQTENPSSNVDIAYAVAVDGTGIYVAGYDYSQGDAQWRIEKRSLTDGTLIWQQTNNPSSGDDVALDIAVDSSGIYAVGYDSSPGNAQWRIEKRRPTDGTLIWQQTENPSSSYSGACGIAIDRTGIYVAGYDSLPGNTQWRIEKRSLTDGTLIWQQTENPSSSYDEAYAVAVDGTGMYVVGTDSLPGNTEWRIEKRSLTDGTLIWQQTNNPSSGDDGAYGVAVDSNGLYIVGYEFVRTDWGWRIEKRSLVPSTLAVLGPYFALAGLAGGIIYILLIRRRRRSKKPVKLQKEVETSLPNLHAPTAHETGKVEPERAAVDGMIRALEARDARPMLSFCSDDVTLSWGSHKFAGKDEIKEWARKLRRVFRELKISERDLAITENSALLEFIMHVAIGERMGEIKGTCKYDFVNGKIQQIRVTLSPGVLFFTEEEARRALL